MLQMKLQKMTQKIYDLETHMIDDFETDVESDAVTENELSQEVLISHEDDDMILMYTNHEEGC